jgi:hypothetical protein
MLSCVSGCGNVENVDHFILGYDFFGRVLSLVMHWLGIYLLNPARLSDHLIQLCSLEGF